MAMLLIKARLLLSTRGIILYIPISDLIIHPTVRPQQERTYKIIQERWSQFHSFFCSLPTGSGKTDLASCILTNYLKENQTNAKIDILVPYRMHQDFWNGILQQYGRKHQFSVSLLKGRGSYYCPIIKSGANIAPCAFDPPYAKTCRSRQHCSLLKARSQIRKSQVRILNWWVFKYVDLGDDKASFRIFDEAHNLLNLESLVRVEVNYSFLSGIVKDQELINQFLDWEKTLLGKNDYIRIDTTTGLSFIQQLQAVLRIRETEIAQKLNENPQTVSIDMLREFRRISELMIALTDLIKNPETSDLTFFFQRDNHKKQPKLIIQPFDISFIFSRLFRGSKNLFMSATIGDGEYLANLLGLNSLHCCYIHESSSFKKENHPFILLKESQKLSTANSNKKRETFQILEEQTRKFLNLLKIYTLRGLILVSSFELSRLMENIAKNTQLRVVTHTAGKSDDAIKRFIAEQQGDVLITPSAWEGISLDDELARICLIPKLPFPMMADPIIRRKAEKYPQFLENDVLISIQQAHGRIQRNPTDWGITICFDGNFRWLKKSLKNSLEPWFLERMHEMTIIDSEGVIKELNEKLGREQRIKDIHNSESKPFSRMKTKDREWLEASGLADLLKK